ncbi:MAG: dihydrodipicolinate reductase C-terminal domain-containing protein [Bacteroidota bacterium]
MKIALIGYGKMGKAIEKIAISSHHIISHKLEKDNSIDSLINNKPDIAIEFTQPESVFENVTFCLENHIPIITGTTGWNDKLSQARALCLERKGTFLFASNFSVGVNLFFELNKWLAEKTKNLNFSPKLHEIHHTEKKDSPSGTAITLAEGIIDS